MIKVHCIAQEYWYVRRQKCKCGGEFELLMQAVATREGTPVDIHKTVCKECGISREFIFDISSSDHPFRGISYKDLAEIEDKLKKVFREQDVSMRMASPMESTLMYINQLADSDDHLALEYIAGAINYSLEKREVKISRPVFIPSGSFPAVGPRRHFDPLPCPHFGQYVVLRLRAG